jgi:curved DNA-binding protein CbpA
MLRPMAEKVPRLLPGVDIRKFKLDPMDGFVMSRIDGKLGPKDLARETGLPDFSVARSLEKLEMLGLLEIVDPNAPPPAPPPPATPRRSAVAQFDDGLLAPKYDPKELEEEAELQPEQKKRILDFFYRLDDLDHYTLLGVTHEADTKTVKRSYFELAATFHPDRYFKKNLGTFKPKMEALFNRITEAHDTLVDPQKRADYDAYLSEVATTRGMEAMLERAMTEAARAPVATPSAPPVSAPPVSPPVSGPSADELKARREALARRLTAGRTGASMKPPEIPHTTVSSADAMDALKRRYEERVESATAAQAQRYVQAAEESLAKNDLVSAATALGIATKFAPDDDALSQRAREVKVLADNALAESYHKQAQYEEKQGHWSDAARSWEKVARLRDDVGSHARAANAILRSADGDLREGAEHAKRAIALAPQQIESHLTLIEIYVKAGLAASARRALDTALKQEPKHPGVQALATRLAKA